MNKLINYLMAMIVFTLVLSGCGNSSSTDVTDSTDGNRQDEQITLSLGHTLTTDSPYHKVGEKFKDEIEKTTNGQVTVDLFPSSQLGGELEMADSVRSGSQDMVIIGQASMENTIPEWQIFSLPYLFASIDEANKVLRSDVGDKYLDMLEDQGLVGLGWLSAIERDVFGNKQIDIENMDGFKVRLMQSPGYIAAYKALGASPTPMAYNELYVSLQQGVVDGADTSIDQFMQDKFVEVSDYFYLSKIHFLPATIVIGKNRWESLDSDLQELVTEASQVAIEYGTQYYKDLYEQSLKDAEAAGVEIIEVDTVKAKEKTEQIRQQLLKNIPNGESMYEELQNAK